MNILYFARRNVSYAEFSQFLHDFHNEYATVGFIAKDPEKKGKVLILIQENINVKRQNLYKNPKYLEMKYDIFMYNLSRFYICIRLLRHSSCYKEPFTHRPGKYYFYCMQLRTTRIFNFIMLGNLDNIIVINLIKPSGPK